LGPSWALSWGPPGPSWAPREAGVGPRGALAGAARCSLPLPPLPRPRTAESGRARARPQQSVTEKGPRGRGHDAWSPDLGHYWHVARMAVLACTTGDQAACMLGGLPRDRHRLADAQNRHRLGGTRIKRSPNTQRVYAGCL